MATQTGSIELSSTNAVKLAAEAGWKSDLGSYYKKSEIDTTVNGITARVSATESSISGHPDCWRIDRYSRPARVNTNNVVPVPDDFVEENFLDTRYRKESDMGTNLQIADYYIAKLTTYVHATAATTITDSFYHDDASAVYLNDEHIAEAAGTTVISVALNLRAGWNKIRFLLNENSGSDYARFATRISTWSNVDQQVADFDEYEGTIQEQRLKTAETSIEQNAEDITLRATKAEFNALSIGGRNLLRDSAFKGSLGQYWVADGLTASISNGTLIVNGSGGSGNKRVYQGLEWFRHTPDTTYVFSCDVVSSAACQITFGRKYAGCNEYHVAFDVTTSVKRVSGVYTATNNAAFCIGQPTNNATVTISNIKLEKGNRATDWTPAPEDMATAAELKVASDNIALKVSKNDVINQINVSTEGATIDAERVNITGATIFTIGRLSESSLNNTYVADRHCEVGQSSSTTTNPWYKVASSSIVAQYVDNVITFDVFNSGGMSTVTRGGRLTAHVRASAGITEAQNTFLTWESRGSDVNLSSFVLAYKVTSGSRIDIELWCRCDIAYAGYHFKVVYEGNRTAAKNGLWTLYNAWTAGSQAAITSGYTQLASSDAIQVGGRNIVYSTADYKGWLLDTVATVSGDVLDINVSGQTANKFYGAKQWLTMDSDDLDTQSIVLSFEVYSDDWASVTSERAAGLDSATVQIVSCPNPYGSSAPGKMARYRYLSLAQTNNWTEQPAQANGKWLRFVSVPIAMPSGLINTDQGTTVGAYLYVNPLVRRNGHVKFRRIKIEVGTKATDWTPAPEDVDAQIDAIQVGSRNLFLNSGRATLSGIANQNNSYTSALTVSETIPAGTEVTVSCQIDATNLAWGSSGQKRAGVEFSVGSSSPYQYIGAWAGAALSESSNVVKVLTGTWSGRISKTVTLKYDLPKGKVYGIYVQQLGSGTCVVSKPKLEVGNRATDWDTAPEDTVRRTQRIYYRKTVTGAPAAPSSWVVSSGDGSNAWTQKHISISSTDKYIYTCEQYEMADGTLGNTSILLDDTITVIDGGKILTGSVEANALKANSLTLGQISTEAQSDILNSNVQVGSRNLLRKTSTLEAEDCVMVRTTVVEPGVFQITPTTSAAYFKFKANYLDYADYGDGEYTLSCEVKLADVETSYTSINLNFYIGYSDAEHYDVAFANNAYHRYVGIGGAGASNPVTDSWQRFSVTFNVPERLTTGSLVLADGVYLSATLYCPGSRKPVLVRHVKLEKGNKASDWSPAPEDVTASINTVSDAVTAATEGLETSISGLSESLKQTNGQLTNLTQAVHDADEERAKWIQADDNGLTIGASDSSYKLQLDNNSVDFMVDDQLAATASVDAFIPTALRLGDYVLSGSGGYLYIDYQPLQTQ